MRAASIAILACLALAACENEGRSGVASAGGRLCTPFPEQANNNAAQRNAATPQAGAPGGPPMAAINPAAGLDDCLHRWGYALAASSDPAGDVAQATVAACSSALTRWNQQALAPSVTGEARASVEAPSLVTGEETNAVAERYSYAQNRALFYVVQARAGKCQAPPMRDGALEGQSDRY